MNDAEPQDKGYHFNVPELTYDEIIAEIAKKDSELAERVRSGSARHLNFPSSDVDEIWKILNGTDVGQRLKDAASTYARDLEDALNAAESNRSRTGDYTKQARDARDKASLIGRLLESELDAVKKVRLRAEQAERDAQAGAQSVSASAQALASASASASANAGAGPIAQVQASMGPSAAPPPDPLVATMGQLSTLLIGSSPAFANAMRLQTDAVASGMGNLNAIANQQAHYTLDLAATARAVAETYSANKKSDMYFYLALNEPAPPPAPAPAPAPKTK